VDEYDVVIVGGGFGGAYAAQVLERSLKRHQRKGNASRVLLISNENFLLFSPVLPEVASGTLESRHAVIPLREMLRSTEIVTGDVQSIDVEARRVVNVDLAGRRSEIDYRFLVLAPGSVPSTYDVPGLQEEAVGFKTLADALWLRNQVLRQLEMAEVSAPAQRRELLTFTFVGGGYAGVEGLAELESLARDAIRRYHRVQPEDMRWVLVEASSSLLPGLDERLAAYTLRQLRRRGIEVHLDTRLESCLGGKVTLSGSAVEPYMSRTVVWTTGQRPNPLGARAGLPTDKVGRVIVDDHMRVADNPGVYAIGDSAAVPDPDGGICPATAQHAMREGKLCGKNVAAELGVGKSAPFRYHNRGLAVTLGNERGTAMVYRAAFRGPLAWFMGRTYHLFMMPGLARKSRVVSDWTIALLYPRDISQFSERSQSKPPLPPPAA
jgi:NADH dehydrogenase